MIIPIVQKIRNVFKIREQEIFYSPTLDSNFALYNISNEAYKYYITKIKNNENEDLYTSRKKLSRNILCSEKLWSRDSNIDRYAYGNLHIYVNKLNHEIVWLKNHKKLGNRLYISYNTINDKLKIELNEVLGLN
jgi:hypothetical protein